MNKYNVLNRNMDMNKSNFLCKLYCSDSLRYFDAHESGKYLKLSKDQCLQKQTFQFLQEEGGSSKKARTLAIVS